MTRARAIAALIAMKLMAVSGISASVPSGRSDGECRPRMDIARDGSQAIVLTYDAAYLFTHARGESWEYGVRALAAARARAAVCARMEAVAFARDGQTIYVSSEGWPAPSSASVAARAPAPAAAAARPP